VPLDRPDIGDHANNIYFEMLADTGVLGILAFAIWLFTIVALIARGARPGEALDVSPGANRAPSERSLWIVTLGTALVAFFIHGLTDYFFEVSAIYLQFWMVLGLLAALVQSPRDGT
jgi:O-antigen ligase